MECSMKHWLQSCHVKKKAHEPKARWFSGSQWVSFCWGLKTHWTFKTPENPWAQMLILPYLAIFEACEFHMSACHFSQNHDGRNPSFFATHPFSPSLNVGSFARHGRDLMQGALAPRMSSIDSDDAVEVKSHWEELGGSAQVWFFGMAMAVDAKITGDVVRLCGFWWW